MSDKELKIQFVKMLLQDPSDPFKAACLVFPDNTQRALRVANEWPLDPEVIEVKNELIEEEGEISFLPTKADLARSIWNRMQSDRIHADDYAKLGKLYADVRGFIEKPTTNINNNMQNVVNKVMVIRDTGSEAEWEDKLRNQQDALTNAATCH